MAVSREAGGVSAFCTRSTARPPDVVDSDRRGGDGFRSSAPDALSSQGGVGARAQKSPVQAGCRGERCSRPTDARDKDGPDAMISSQSKESPAEEIVRGEGGLSRRDARGLRCTRRRCPGKGTLSYTTTMGSALSGVAPDVSGPGLARHPSRGTSEAKRSLLKTLSEEGSSGTPASAASCSEVDVPNLMEPRSPSHSSRASKNARSARSETGDVRVG